ncbi:hypothetical protein [Cryptosporidium hominis TU502]|uniref:hypothetical protein n=1 Tax=Cryptosporidium hominis (strain TU502) TaxID=353151 RepID=UPI0000452928|nr:hypothetical protein [Cryptosporidium hominis TU502]
MFINYYSNSIVRMHMQLLTSQFFYLFYFTLLTPMPRPKYSKSQSPLLAMHKPPNVGGKHGTESTNIKNCQVKGKFSNKERKRK